MSMHSVGIARERLKHLLIADRMHCSLAYTDLLAADLYHTLSKYVEIKREDFALDITRCYIHIRYTGEEH